MIERHHRREAQDPTHERELRLHLHAFEQLHGTSNERHDRALHDVGGRGAERQVIDHLGLGEYGTHARDRHGIVRHGRECPDVLGGVAQIARGLLQERPRARRALVVQAKRLDPPHIVQLRGLHRLAADVEDRTSRREEEGSPARGGREVRDLHVAERHLKAAVAGADRHRRPRRALPRHRGARHRTLSATPLRGESRSAPWPCPRWSRPRTGSPPWYRSIPRQRPPCISLMSP